ncbi:MAG: hemagglutinin protein [Bacteroidetes bacterium]|nr:hemagglutinin protein [Bacteroidota bacterium]
MALFAVAFFNLYADNGIKVSPKMFLKGALGSDGLMRDDLRSKGLLPATEPYSALPNFQHYGGGGGETVASPNVFKTLGNNAIVDWVVVELRSENAMSTPLATRSALLQRDGDVVDIDGFSPIKFPLLQGKYYVVVRHRNHLGVMTAAPKNLSYTTTLVDFTDPTMPLYGTNACYSTPYYRALWLGDTNHDKKVVSQGAYNDVDGLFFQVIQTPANTSYSLNYILTGYFDTDINLDGNVIFNGPNNDPSVIFNQLINSCSGTPCLPTEQIP